ncbi:MULTISPECIES: DUF1801 domain-containing protein [unclassified Pedobacter]|uniref:DUF1801 domain-containing protein n=1 Tax=unclassified Pedobacter TaxID=2628915 RepID=UPI001E468839|nr:MULTISPECIES: DUF1801 domain-containing protein [unclassified Pedobacter]
MEQSIKPSPTEQVSAYIDKLEPNVAEIIQAIRKLILSTDKEIAEHIKWNSPSFYYTGKIKDFDAKEYKRDIAVLNLNKQRIMLVLPTGDRITESLDLLEGNYKDGRRIINFKDLDDVLSKATKLQKAIENWLQTVEQ